MKFLISNQRRTALMYKKKIVNLSVAFEGKNQPLKPEDVPDNVKYTFTTKKTRRIDGLGHQQHL